MRITEIEPGKKYVLVFPDIKIQEKAEGIASALRSFMRDKEHTLFFVYGTEMAVVPADQIVGYTTLEQE